MVPMAMPRARDTPFQSGVAYAIGCRKVGSSVTGKNTPLKMNRGVMMKRLMAGKLASPVRVTVKAMMGSANASPVRMATGIIAMPRGMSVARKMTITMTNAVLTMARRTIIHRDVPVTTWNAEMGVEIIDWKVRFQVMADMMGYIASPAAVCIAWDASSPGARNTRYETPSMPPEADWSTKVPSPRPMASRNRTGARNVVNRPPRQVRR